MNQIHRAAMTSAMIESELILRLVAKNSHLSEADAHAEQVVNTILGRISDAFADGNR